MPDKKLARLGEKIKRQRLERHMTQVKVSDASGITVRTISKIECGEMNPSFEILSALVSVLGMSMDSLFLPDDAPEDADTQELIALYSACPKIGRRLILQTVRTITQELSDICQE